MRRYRARHREASTPTRREIQANLRRAVLVAQEWARRDGRTLDVPRRLLKASGLL